MEQLIPRHEAGRSMAATVERAAAAAEIKEHDKEADRLFNLLEKHVEEKRKRDFHIRLLKGELEVRETYPRGVPQGPSPDQLREQREAEEKQKKKDPLKHWVVRAQCFSTRRQRALARRAAASGGNPHVERPATPHPPCAAAVAGRS